MNKGFWVVIVLLIVAVIGLLLYTGPEEKAQLAYEQAFQVEQTADAERAMQLYDQVIAEYPGTEGAAQAEAGKVRIVQMKEKLLKKEMRDQIERIQLVLNGYRSMFGSLPASIAELDTGEYFFDSDYLAEVVPEGYTTYLVLSADAPRIWPLRADRDELFAATDRHGSLQKLDKSAVLVEIEAGYEEVARKGRMVFLRAK